MGAKPTVLYMNLSHLSWPTPMTSSSLKNMEIVPIQVCFVNSFSDLHAYNFHFSSIDFKKHLGKICPLCKKRCGFRRISFYERTVIELFPFECFQVKVARFQCQQKRYQTFSLLPHQLVPYHVYSAQSIVYLCLLLKVCLTTESLEQRIFKYCSEAKLLPFLVRRWLAMLSRQFFQRLSVLGFFESGLVHEFVNLHCDFATTARSPPWCNDLFVLFSTFSSAFLLGTASQQRSCA